MELGSSTFIPIYGRRWLTSLNFMGSRRKPAEERHLTNYSTTMALVFPNSLIRPLHRAIILPFLWPPTALFTICCRRTPFLVNSKYAPLSLSPPFTPWFKVSGYFLRRTINSMDSAYPAISNLNLIPGFELKKKWRK